MHEREHQSFVRPNWKKSAEYASLESAPLSHIAWEFLRRNADYAKAWAEYAATVKAIAAPDPQVARYAVYILHPAPTREIFDALGNDDERNNLRIKLNEMGLWAQVSGTRTTEHLDRTHGRPWGLECIEHPDTEYHFFRIKFKEKGNSIIEPSGYGLERLEKEEGENGLLHNSKWLVVQIDLSLPLRVIESNLLRHIKDSRSHRIEEGAFTPISNRALPNARYIEYLRILDAFAAGIGANETGECLAPRADNSAPERSRDKRFRAALIEAQRLQKDGYKVLPLLYQKPIARKNKVSG